RAMLCGAVQNAEDISSDAQNGPVVILYRGLSPAPRRILRQKKKSASKLRAGRPTPKRPQARQKKLPVNPEVFVLLSKVYSPFLFQIYFDLQKIDCPRPNFYFILWSLNFKNSWAPMM